MFTGKRFDVSGHPHALDVLRGSWGVARKGAVGGERSINPRRFCHPVKEENSFPGVLSNEGLLPEIISKSK